MPAVVESWPAQTVWFTSQQPAQPSEVVVEGSLCRPPVGVGVFAGCPLVEPGTYRYTVTGFGAGHGAITVRPVEWVSIEPARATVVYGRGLRLSGRAYFPPRPGDPPPPPIWRIGIRGERPTGPPTSATGMVRDASGEAVVAPAFGEWAAIVFPRTATVYSAEWRGHRSTPVEVAVRPSVRLRLDGGRLCVGVRPGAPWRGRRAALQRQRPDRSWDDVAAVRLNTEARGCAGAPRGAGLLRAAVPPASGYVAGWSRPVVAPARASS